MKKQELLSLNLTLGKIADALQTHDRLAAVKELYELKAIPYESYVQYLREYLEIPKN